MMNVPPYQVVLLPRAVDALDRRDRNEQAKILDALESELDLGGRSSFVVDGRTYHEVPLSTGTAAVVRPLTEEEFQHRVKRKVLSPDPPTAYAVFTIGPSGAR